MDILELGHNFESDVQDCHQGLSSAFDLLVHSVMLMFALSV